MVKKMYCPKCKTVVLKELKKKVKCNSKYKYIKEWAQKVVKRPCPKQLHDCARDYGGACQRCGLILEEPGVIICYSDSLLKVYNSKLVQYEGRYYRALRGQRLTIIKVPYPKKNKSADRWIEEKIFEGDSEKNIKKLARVIRPEDSQDYIGRKKHENDGDNNRARCE